MDLRAAPFLIVGLGNPGSEYEKTRHNVGFMVVSSLANQLGISLQKKKEFVSQFAQGVLAGNKVILLLPMTYMNLSGDAVRRCMDFYKIPKENVVVVSDDVALPFGKLRIRKKGSSGGHNGLKNIEQRLASSDFIRVKVGVGFDSTMDLADYVLATFTKVEQATLPSLIEETNAVLMTLIKDGYDKAVECIDTLSKAKVPKEKKATQEEVKKNIKEDKSLE
jgi:PTH1 family peptidyl-tRNA hydrolase